MTDLTVIIPSWDADRAATALWDLVRREKRQRAHYIIVGVAAPASLHEDLRDLSHWAVPPHPLAPVEAMALGAATAEIEHAHRNPDILCFFHDDMTITEDHAGWDRTILDHFETHPKCGLAGFGGGLGFGTDDIYKTPYHYQQLPRIDFISNMQEAALHGRRVTVPTQVAALDGFSLIVSPELHDAGGYETWMLPVGCHHVGGQTSVGMSERYAQVVARLGYESPEDLYHKAHRRIYERFQRVLPIRR